MTRRARSTYTIKLVIGSLVACLVLVGLGAYFFEATSTPYRTVPDFPVEEYLNGSSALRGNSYRLSGTVLNILNSDHWDRELGRLISIDPEGEKPPIPVFIPKKVVQNNIQKGQRLIFLVDVRQGGIVFTRELTKQ